MVAPQDMRFRKYLNRFKRLESEVAKGTGGGGAGTPGGSDNQIQYNTSGYFDATTNFVVDDSDPANIKIGIGTASPTNTLTVVGESSSGPYFEQDGLLLATTLDNATEKIARIVMPSYYQASLKYSVLEGATGTTGATSSLSWGGTEESFAGVCRQAFYTAPINGVPGVVCLYLGSDNNATFYGNLDVAGIVNGGGAPISSYYSASNHTHGGGAGNTVVVDTTKGTTNGPTTTSTSYVAFTDASLVRSPGAANAYAMVGFHILCYHSLSSNETIAISIRLDSETVTDECQEMCPTANIQHSFAVIKGYYGMSAVSHTFTPQWKTGAGTATSPGTVWRRITASWSW